MIPRFGLLPLLLLAGSLPPPPPPRRRPTDDELLANMPTERAVLSLIPGTSDQALLEHALRLERLAGRDRVVLALEARLLELGHQVPSLVSP